MITADLYLCFFQYCFTALTFIYNYISKWSFFLIINIIIIKIIVSGGVVLAFIVLGSVPNIMPTPLTFISYLSDFLARRNYDINSLRVFAENYISSFPTLAPIHHLTSTHTLFP